MLQRFSKISRLWLQGKRLALTGCLKHIPQKVHFTRHPDHLEDELPENRCRCGNLQSEAKWSLAGSLYGNVLEFPFAAKANQPSFAWCHGHGAKRMIHPSQKVVTSGIAWNTIDRKWWPTSVSRPYKPSDGFTSASVSLRSVEPSSKSQFED